ncbi:RsmD family RNA methyltransferase [Candidatus Woesearchaeota archaeon]|nr:RsmD family RNA methyltransferase [Candidatus Woesearchaeota archaeon]
MSIRSKKDLEVLLSKLKNYENPSFQLEQYPTPAHIAAEWIWNMAMAGEVANKTILDAACGPGILGLGLLLLGAKHVIFVDKDPKIIRICQHNYNTLAEEYELGKAEFIVSDIQLVDVDADIVVENPPFGTKNEHIDKVFLEKAFATAKIIYSMHKYSTKRFVEAVAKDHHFKITHLWQYAFPIKATFAFHEKPVKKVDVGLWRMEKR